MNRIKEFYVFIIIGLIVICTFIFEPFRSEPPTPKITTGKSVIPTTQGSFCWDGPLFARCVDKIYSSPLEMAKVHKPMIVSPNQEIKIKFKKEPLAGTLIVEELRNENSIKNIKVKNAKISAPKEKGVYFYLVIANWKNGSGNHAFSIEVK
ncbi:hypothetical protein [Viridibacillus arvi]|uniref:hypothetical protein n=1 Tax=Viridibacillus arvi TaxID=263475 RepID=UPI003CFEC853